MIYKLIQWFKRNACDKCDYYHADNNTCQSKKCATKCATCVQLVDVIHMLIGLTDIFAKHTKQKGAIRNDT